MRRVLLTGALLLAVAAPAGAQPSDPPGESTTAVPPAEAQTVEMPADSPPNLLLAVVDTLRADHLGCYGYFRPTSPRIDGLAADGVRFAQAVTVMPHTLPAHLTLFTSRYPGEHGVRRNGLAYDGRFPTLAELLRKKGYATAAFVSGAPVNASSGLDRGFDTYVDSPGHKTPGGEAVAAALKWLDGVGKQPFFLWVHLFDPHVGYAPPEKHRVFKTDDRLISSLQGKGTTSFERWGDISDRVGLTEIVAQNGELPFHKNINLYDAEVLHADEHVGRLVDALAASARLESTLIVFTSDHGEGLGEHDFWFHGLHLYEEQIRIPLILRFPGRAHAGRALDPQVSLIDVGPTVLEALGLPRGDGMRGDSLVDMIESGDDAGGKPYVFFERRLYPKRTPLSPLHWTKRRQYGVRTPEWKLTVESAPNGKRQVVALYDLRRDPEELVNVARQEPRQARQLRKVLSEWLKSQATAPPSQEGMSEEDLEKLKSLGYVDGD